jgi:regulation of enolase protein 1 (concanavalin A-like superfamily)
MKKAVVMITVVILGVANSQGADPRDQSITPNYSDEFNGTTLDPKWSFDNPAPNPGGQSWSLTLNPGFLTMTTTGPTDLIGGTNTAPKMLELAPGGNFSIWVRVLAAPDIAFEHAGILVMFSPTDWVRLIRDANGNSVYLQSSTGSGVNVPYAGHDVVLRLSKLSSMFQGAFSVDGGLNYTVIGATIGPLYPSTIGMTIASTPAGNVFTAAFDYFRVTDDINIDHAAVPSSSNLSIAILVLLLIGSAVAIRWRAV